ncbi:hypothetical protein FM104_13330 [Microbacterium esteraromaticum]|uniref:Uncharacterized protein n=1 Tax=Microbacterium esteraromaticum TaxID=57043 RepID=A0A1R4KJ88_9MICO|nr:hypothetical protein FM104_13330 [Microbacterium esteraromaticum]
MRRCLRRAPRNPLNSHLDGVVQFFATRINPVMPVDQAEAD